MVESSPTCFFVCIQYISLWTNGVHIYIEMHIQNESMDASVFLHVAFLFDVSENSSDNTTCGRRYGNRYLVFVLQKR